MQKSILALALIGATGTFPATAALAQTVVETPEGNTAVVSDPALQPGTPVGAVTVPTFPLAEQIENDQAVIDTLLSQGFTDIRILREGPIMTINAQRDGQPTELVYSIANGSLVSVDGVELRAEPDTSGDGAEAGNSAAGDDAGEGADGDAGEGEGEGQSEGGADGDGSDGGADGGDGSDGGSDGGDGSDGGSEGNGSDG